MMNQNELVVINKLKQVEFDIAFIKSNLNRIVADLEKAKTDDRPHHEINRWKKYKSQQERYLCYAKAYKKNLQEEHKDVCEEWKKQMMELLS